MITINLKNIEEFVFKNKLLRSKLPEFQAYFDQWGLSQQHPSLRSIGKQAVIDLLNHLTENHISIIKSHFNTDVTINKFSNWVVKNVKTDLQNLEIELNSFDLSAQICAYRKDDQIYISLWR
jgi:hypothetical protein